MADFSGPKELSRALRVLDSPDTEWIRQFMLVSDYAADLSILLSPAQLGSSCTFKDYGCGSSLGSIKFDYGGETRYLLVPAFSVGDYTVGIAVYGAFNCQAEMGDSDDKAVIPSKISIDYDYGKFCLTNSTGELLLLTSVLPTEADNSLETLAVMLSMQCRRQITVSPAMQMRSRTKVLWWAPDELSSDRPFPWKGRQQLIALCDTQMLLAGNYSQSLAMSVCTESMERTACAACCDKVVLSRMIDGEGTLRENACSCYRPLIRPSYPLDFGKLTPNLTSTGGNFAGLSVITIGLPGVDQKVVIPAMSSLSLVFSATKFIGEELRNVAIHGVMQVARIPQDAWMCSALTACSVQNNLIELTSSSDVPVFQTENDTVMQSDSANLYSNHCSNTESHGDCADLDLLDQVSLLDLSTDYFPSASPLALTSNGNDSVCEGALHLSSSRGTAIAIAPGHGEDYNAVRAAAVDTETQAKKDLRKMKNRAAAARSNAKRKEYNDSLKRNLREAKEHVTALQDRYATLQDERLELIQALSSP